MSEEKKTPLRPYLWLVVLIGVIVPRRLRSDWRQEWEAELRNRELRLADWDRLNWKTKLDLLCRSLGAFRDAVMLQPQRLEDEMFQDLRYGARMLLRQPGFTLVAVLSLALGIGANTAIFSLIDVLLIKSLPVQQPDKLVLFGKGESAGVTIGFPNDSWDLFSYPFYRQVQQNHEVFSDVGALLSIPWNVHGSVNTSEAAGQAEQMDVQLVSGTYFSVLGVKASIGRVLSDTDDQNTGGHPVAVISNAWWERRLGGDPAVVGKTITIDQVVYTIIGVAPREFFGTTVGQAPDLWVPLAMGARMPPAHWDGRNDPVFQSLYLIARTRDGVSLEQANAAVNVHFKQFLQEAAGAQPPAERLQAIERASIELTPGGRGLSELRREFSLSLRILMAVVGVVLLIACANVANLLLARAEARQKEFAVRLALGASRARLIRQLLTESVLLSGMGALAGILLAWWGSRLLVVMTSSGAESLPIDVTPNARILSFTLFASLMSALVFGTAPALRAARLEPNASLKGGRGVVRASSRSWLGKSLVVGQVTLSLLLLVGAGLFVRTLINLQSVPTGFDQQNVLLFKMDTATTGYAEEARRAALFRDVEEKVEALPAVQSASFAFWIFNQGGWNSHAYSREQPAPEAADRLTSNNVVGPDYFNAMGIPLLLGRGFGPQDTDESQKVAVINETMARLFFPTGSLGKRFGINGPESSEKFEVIGVVKDAKSASLTEQPRPGAYYPHAQGSGFLDNFVVRYSGAPGAVIPQIREAISQVNTNLPVDEVVSLSEHVGRSLVQQKLIARLASFFGLLALLLACVGLYGTLSYSVAQRTHEIGIRLALGAPSRNVLWLILSDALVLVFGGVIIGLLAAWWVTSLAESLLFGLKPTDPTTLAAATVLLITFASLAGFLPARRAARVDPLVALRDE
jgi:predicted permease